MLEIVECYRTVDGQLFESKNKAIEHEDDLIGQELNELFKLFGALSGNNAVGHAAIYSFCINALKDKEKLASICKTIAETINGDL